MKSKSPKNIAASVRQRLLNKARADERPFNEMLQYFAIERFLYRLSKSPHAQKFVLKGALMLFMWDAPMTRPTKDIDLLGKAGNDIEALTMMAKDICLQQVKPDGLTFDSETIEAERITEDADYKGIRIRLKARLDTARINLQIDIGFGDVVFPSVTKNEYPTILNLPAPLIHGYSRESTISEKYEAMVKLGRLNSRMKDFFDIHLLSRQFDFEGRTLSEAVKKTFDKRGTDLPSDFNAFANILADDAQKTVQWEAFIKRNRLETTKYSFAEAIAGIISFLAPVSNTIASGSTYQLNWKAPGPWT